MRAPLAERVPVSVSMVLIALLVLTGGCFRYQTRVPGVVDMRSDAVDAERVRPEPPDDDEIAREQGLDLVLGAGVSTARDRVLVEDRHIFLRGFVPVWNTSAHEELDAALSLSGALRDVEIGEEYGVLDVGITLLASFLPLANWLVPSTYTFLGSGEAVLAGEQPRGQRALPLPLGGDLPPPPPLDDLGAMDPLDAPALEEE